MGKFIPVDADRWVELVKAAGERDAFAVEIDRLKADLAKSEEHNAALCERMSDLNSELFAASNINGKLHIKRVHDLNQMGGQCEEIARLNSLFANSERENVRLKAEVERLTPLLGDIVPFNEYLEEKEHAERLHIENSILMKETARLKAEVERLKEGNECLDKMHEKEMARAAYLLEEFNRTTAWGRGLESDLSHARVEISFLKAEVQRLRKAGDTLADFFVPDIDDLGHNYGFKKSVESVISNWNAAKEGKESE